MQTLTLTTCRLYPELPANLEPLVERLRADFQVVCEPWQNVRKSDIILPLCAWDYAQTPERFRTWIDAMSLSRAQFVNPPNLMKWNMHKSYLCDLADWGVNVIPTRYLPHADMAQIRQCLAENQWTEAVLKPAIGQSGRFLQKISEKRPLADLRLYRHGVIVQPFIAEIQTAGETSLIFLDGEFSHAVRRQPAAKDWRANSAYGVTIQAQSVTDNIIQQAKKTLLVLPSMPCYARVDGIIIGNQFLLNELELIEPALYMTQSTSAETRFLQALQSYAQSYSYKRSNLPKNLQK